MSKKGYWLGKHRSEETKKKLSEARKGKTIVELGHKLDCQCPFCKAERGELKGKNSPSYGKSSSEKTKEKISNTLKGRKPSKKHRENLSKAAKNKVMSENHKKNISIALEGRKLSEEHKKALKGQFPWHKGKINVYSNKTLKQLSSAVKNLWQTPEYVQNQMRARNICPNKAELLLNTILQQFLPNEYKYVGNGEFILAGKCPDFININGQKKIIELYGNYWHRGETGKDRIDLFRQYGYETLIVWESELENKKCLRQKILKFHEQSVHIN